MVWESNNVKLPVGVFDPEMPASRWTEEWSISVMELNTSELRAAYSSRIARVGQTHIALCMLIDRHAILSDLEAIGFVVWG